MRSSSRSIERHRSVGAVSPTMGCLKTAPKAPHRNRSAARRPHAECVVLSEVRGAADNSPREGAESAIFVSEHPWL